MMNPKRKRRLCFILLILGGVSISAALILYALKKNINLFYTPTQIATGEAPKHKLIRMGGLVEKGSVKKMEKSLKVRFKLTDLKHTVIVDYDGILPDLFREGQGIVTLGKIDTGGHFVAREVLAKHDATYMPPEVKQALERAGRKYDS